MNKLPEPLDALNQMVMAAVRINPKLKPRKVTVNKIFFDTLIQWYKSQWPLEINITHTVVEYIRDYLGIELLHDGEEDSAPIGVEGVEVSFYVTSNLSEIDWREAKGRRVSHIWVNKDNKTYRSDRTYRIPIMPEITINNPGTKLPDEFPNESIDLEVILVPWMPEEVIWVG